MLRLPGASASVPPDADLQAVTAPEGDVGNAGDEGDLGCLVLPSLTMAEVGLKGAGKGFLVRLNRGFFCRWHYPCFWEGMGEKSKIQHVQT